MTIKAILLNCSLKSSDEESNTQSLMNEAIKIFDKERIDSEVVRVADYNVAHGISDDEGDGDEWPKISEKIKAADIIVIGTPL